MKDMKLHESIINIRCALQRRGIKKTGRNKFANFSYFELSDFLPTLNELMLEYGVNDVVDFDGDRATLTLIKGEEKQQYGMPFFNFPTPLNNNGQPLMQPIQYLGAQDTYYKRYLYMNAFGITDGDVIDTVDNKELVLPAKITQKQAEELGELEGFINLTPAERNRFFAFAGASRLEDISSDRYEGVKDALVKKGHKIKKEAE